MIRLDFLSLYDLVSWGKTLVHSRRRVPKRGVVLTWSLTRGNCSKRSEVVPCQRPKHRKVSRSGDRVRVQLAWRRLVVKEAREGRYPTRTTSCWILKSWQIIQLRHYCLQYWWVIKTHWGLVTPYGHVDLGQHWFRYWLVAWRHQAITWTNVDLSSVRSCGIHVRAISQEIPQPSITKISLKITSLEFISNLLGANELKYNRIIIDYYCYTPATKLGGVYWIQPVCLSVCPSVCLSVCPLTFSCPPCSIYSSGWILSIFGTNYQ